MEQLEVQQEQPKVEQQQQLEVKLEVHQAKVKQDQLDGKKEDESIKCKISHINKVSKEKFSNFLYYR